MRFVWGIFGATLIGGALFAAVLMPSQTLAQAPAAPADRGLFSQVSDDCYTQGDCGPCDVMGIVAQGIKILFYFLGTAALLMVIWAGVLVTQVGQNKGNLKKAEDLIKNIVIGVVLAYGSFIIVNTALHLMLGEGPTLWSQPAKIFGSEWDSFCPDAAPATPPPPAPAAPANP